MQLLQLIPVTISAVWTRQSPIAVVLVDADDTKLKSVVAVVPLRLNILVAPNDISVNMLKNNTNINNIETKDLDLFIFFPLKNILLKVSICIQNLIYFELLFFAIIQSNYTP
jgi:hypothetical protein